MRKTGLRKIREKEGRKTSREKSYISLGGLSLFMKKEKLSLLVLKASIGNAKRAKTGQKI